MATVAPWWSMLQCRLLGVLLVGRGEVVNGILDNVMRVHGLLEAAGNALHWGTATWRAKWKRPMRNSKVLQN